mmetsp:Transcript_8561/g.25358  ORF Transcript_8561/g.25358 Transcript_8561/m.25358 type:complete len:107 (+) Transcript_8561:265-585(+)
MIARSTKLLSFLLVIAALLSADAGSSNMTREKLLEDRKKKVVHLEHAMKQIQKQLDDYHKGHKRLDQNRVKSLKNRLASYKGQIYDYSKELSDKEIEELLGYHSEL